MAERFETEVARVLSSARKEALRLGDEIINRQHVLIAMLRDPSPKVIKLISDIRLHCNDILSALESSVFPGNASDIAAKELPFTQSVQTALEYAVVLAGNAKLEKIGVEYVLAAILKEPPLPIRNALKDSGINYPMILGALDRLE